MKNILGLFLALLLLACGAGQDFSHQGGAAGAEFGPVTAGAAAHEMPLGSVNPGAGGSAEGGSRAAEDPHNGGGSAVTPATGGGPTSSGGQSTAGSPAAPGGEGGTGGTGGELVAAGVAGSPAAGSGGTGSTCTPQSWDAACAGRSCGKAPTGCGDDYVCGTCAGQTECVEGACGVTCESAELECGQHPQHELDCGECPDGQQCGVVGVGKCSTCKEIGPNAAICPGPSKLWRTCGSAPVADCWHPPDAGAFDWCCL